jgi:hypothetical protein
MPRGGRTFGSSRTPTPTGWLQMWGLARMSYAVRVYGVAFAFVSQKPRRGRRPRRPAFQTKTPHRGVFITSAARSAQFQIRPRSGHLRPVGHGRHRRAGKAGGATAQKRFSLGKTKEMGWISSLRQRLQQANRRVPPHRLSRPVRPFSPSAPSGRSRVSSRRRGNRTGK